MEKCLCVDRALPRTKMIASNAFRHKIVQICTLFVWLWSTWSRSVKKCFNCHITARVLCFGRSKIWANCHLGCDEFFAWKESHWAMNVHWKWMLDWVGCVARNEEGRSLLWCLIRCRLSVKFRSVLKFRKSIN